MITYSSRPFQKQSYMYCVFNGMIINKLTHANQKGQCLNRHHCLIIYKKHTHIRTLSPWNTAVNYLWFKIMYDCVNIHPVQCQIL
jgi:hypothetical protein